MGPNTGWPIFVLCTRHPWVRLLAENWKRPPPSGPGPLTRGAQRAGRTRAFSAWRDSGESRGAEALGSQSAPCRFRKGDSERQAFLVTVLAPGHPRDAEPDVRTATPQRGRARAQRSDGRPARRPPAVQRCGLRVSRTPRVAGLTAILRTSRAVGLRRQRNEVRTGCPLFKGSGAPEVARPGPRSRGVSAVSVPTRPLLPAALTTGQRNGKGEHTASHGTDAGRYADEPRIQNT